MSNLPTIKRIRGIVLINETAVIISKKISIANKVLMRKVAFECNYLRDGE